MSVIEITKENFEQEVLQSDKPVMMDFYADWCTTCKMMAPMIEEIAEEEKDIKVGKMNIANAMAVARKYGVMSIPAFVIFKDGEAVKKASGEKSKNDMLDFIRTV